MAEQKYRLVLSGDVVVGFTRNEVSSALARLLKMSEEQATAVIADSIEALWPDKERETLGNGRIGYSVRVWWGIDHDTLSAEALSVDKGEFAFSVKNAGTAPAAGNPARERLLKEILRRAVAVSRSDQ